LFINKLSDLNSQKFTITGPAQLVLRSFSSSGKYDAAAKGNFELGDVLPLQKRFYPIRIEYFQKDESCSLNLVYLIPDADNPINIPAKFLYHK
jgi:hypothetical protein